MHAAPTRAAVRVLEAAAALALLLLMTLVLLDVGGRNLFNHPIPWATEILEVIVGVMIFLLYPVLALQGGHITVDLFQFSPRVKWVQRGLGAIIGAALFSVISYCLGHQTLRAAGYGEASPILGLPLAWVLGTLCALAGICALAFLISLVGVLRGDAQAPHALENI